MGKTYRSVFSGSQSVDYHSKHSRKILGLKKRNSRKKIRNNNKKCDEDFIKSSKHIKNKVKNHWASIYYGKIGNIPNIKGNRIDNLKVRYIILNSCCDKYIGYLKWNNDGNIKDILNNHIKNNHYDSKYFAATRKQIKRRGIAKQFKGHRLQI